MIIIEAPNVDVFSDTRIRVFIAGGITDCPNWQSEVLHDFKSENIIVYNPRRANFPIHDPSAALSQIKWEHNCLRISDAILFWFPKETLCPIALYELGAWTMSKKPIFVGTHLDYKRRQDVIIQTQLVRPEVVVRSNLLEICQDFKTWLKYIQEMK